MKTRQVVYSYGMAKYLLSEGYEMVDLDMHRERKGVIFVFKNSIGLNQAMSDFIEELEKDKLKRAN